MFRNDFPILKQQVHENTLVYFDNAASSQKPLQVIETITAYYTTQHSNVHRGAHFLSQQATQKFENARETIAQHINSKTQEVIFTKGTTHSINIFTRAIESFIVKNDEIIICVSEHHSNLVVFQELAKRREAILKYVPLTKNQEFDYNAFNKMITSKTKLISFAIISNVIGERLDLRKIKQIIDNSNKKYNTDTDDIILAYDCAQVIGHHNINFSSIGCDCIYFSAHKAYGPTGIGALVIKEELLERLEPVEFGGAMIERVDLDSKKTTYKHSFEKFEPGTPDICGALAFKSAIEYIDSIGIDTIIKHEKELIRYFFLKSQTIENMIIIGPQHLDTKAGVISFYIKGVHSYDIATLLDLKGIAIREGAHCAQPLLNNIGINSLLRVSFALYNTIEEIDYFFESLELILETLS